jgi:hypothetical protein
MLGLIKLANYTIPAAPIGRLLKNPDNGALAISPAAGII